MNMIRLARQAFAIGLTAAAAASGAANKGNDGTSGSATLYGVGEIVIADARILDLTGAYDLASTETSASVTLNIVQDARGKLVGTYVLTEADGVTTAGPFPAAGNLAVEREKTVKFTFTGSANEPGGPGNGRGPGNGKGNGRGRGKSSMQAKGVYTGAAFAVEVRLKNKSGQQRWEGPLTPENPARGATVSDGVGMGVRKNASASTRTVTLPWGGAELNALQRRAGDHTHFYASSGMAGKSKRGKGLGKPGVFETRIKGEGTSGSAFVVYENRVRLGYGHLNSAAFTTVAPSAPATAAVLRGR